MRRRPGRGVAVAVGAALVLAAVAAGVALRGGGVQPPATAAARLVPADALAYLNLSLDPRRPSVRRASSLPGFVVARAVTLARLGSLTGLGRGERFLAAARPWIGNEAALALLPHGRRASGLILLAVRNLAAARRFLAARRFPRGVVGRLVSGFLAVGAPRDVRALGRTPSLATTAAFQQAAAGEPDDRVLDLYASGVGVVRLLGGRGRAAAALQALLSPAQLISLSASLSPVPGGARLQVHRVLGGRGGPSGSLMPSLASLAPAGSGLFIDLLDLPRQAPGLLAAASDLGIGGAIGPLLARLGAALHAEGIDVTALLSLFRGETAVVVSSSARRPALLILTRTGSLSAARVALAQLEPPLAALFPAGSGSGAEPLFTSRTIAGTTIHQVQLGTGLQIDYAVWRGLIGISTGFDALASAVRRGPSLNGDHLFETTVGNTGDGAGSLVFLDLKVLTRLAAQAGLLRGASFASLAGELARIRAIGLRSTGGQTDTTSELFFNIP